ncbi:MAG: DUF1491 family protein [Azospirillaceae bacterium]
MSDDPDPRLPTHLIVSAALGRCNTEAVPAYVVKRGEAMGGLVLLKLDLLDGSSRLLVQSRDLDGHVVWMPAGKGGTMAEADARDYIARATARDPDLWVIEIEHRAGWHPFEGREMAG